jgi:hypothetical protein
MLIRVLIFSTLVLAVNLVAGIFAKDQTNQGLSLKNQHDFHTEGQILKLFLSLIQPSYLQSIIKTAIKFFKSFCSSHCIFRPSIDHHQVSKSC